MGANGRTELGRALGDCFCRTDPAIAKAFARVTLPLDTRAEVARLTLPTLILQTQADMIAPLEMGEYVHAALPDSELVVMEATGRRPHMSAPEETIVAIKRYLGR